MKAQKGDRNMNRKKILVLLTAAMMPIFMLGGDTVKAEEIVDEPIEAEIIDGKEFNCIERPYVGENYAVTERSGLYSESRDASDNTDPNYAYVVSNDAVMQGTIQAEGEMRWYAFSLNEKSKVSILLQMVETLDADLYMYALNEETYGLELIGGSAQEGAGIYEYYNSVMEAGTYFFAVGGYEGTGNFAFAFYESTADVSNEENDSLDTATAIKLSSDIEGVIDSPYDIDYYKFSISSPTVIQYSISSEKGYSLLYAGKSGDDANIYTLESSKKQYKFMPGTYYFAVRSENGSYSVSDVYTIHFKKIGVMSSNSELTIVGVSEEAGIIYQTNRSGSINYVNGNPIDISYSYYQSFSNSAGSQYYDISIDANAGACASLSGMYEPAAVHYYNSTKPAMHVSDRPALMLTYTGNAFYKIHCRCTKEYAKNSLWQDHNAVTVLIDPETGKLIDIVDFNYYYDFCPVGTNYITWARIYQPMMFYEH